MAVGSRSTMLTALDAECFHAFAFRWNVPMVSARVGAALAFAASLAFGQEPDPVVRAAAPEPVDAPSDDFIAAIYDAAERGGRLYDAGQYAEAVPYLTVAAERGLKVPQASLGDILLNGRGGVPRDTEAGIGWLGVAAEPETLSRIETYFDRAMAQLPPDYRPTASRIVDGYAALYSNHRHRVACRLYGDVVEDLRCLFIDDQGDATGAGDIEEMVVTAPVITVPGPEFGQMPSGQFISQVYNAYSQGADLYKDKRYKEALPYLLAAAKRGFKWAQASAADIYLHGRGGVPVDLEAGIGWLGVAAEPRTAYSIVEFYEESRALLPTRYTPEAVEEIVATYRAEYANAQHRVACRSDAFDPSSSIRIKSVRCHFIDMVTQCRYVELTPSRVTWEWECPPLRGARSIVHTHQ
ncbi:MAG: hypothetical protein OXH15_06855 [Gammaproteobacteria bacterium]|nr:hypothetical protein [Gammaproteobacteria bacterium]